MTHVFASNKMLVTNKVFIINEISNINNNNQLIEKFVKPKTRKLFKLKKSKSEKLSKLRKSKSKKSFKSQNLAKRKKKLSKSGNLPNFDAKEIELSFLTFNTKITFNHL